MVRPQEIFRAGQGGRPHETAAAVVNLPVRDTPTGPRFPSFGGPGPFTVGMQISITERWTRKLGSDHRAVFYRARIGRHGWLFVSYNIGPGKLADVLAIVDEAEAESPGHWSLALQEGGDQDRLFDQVVDQRDVDLVRHHPSQPRGKVALILPPDIIVGRGLVKLSPRTFVGDPGAGPRFTEPKYVVRARVRVGTLLLRIGGVHFTPLSGYVARRFRLLRKAVHALQVRRATAWGAAFPGVPSVLVGDMNAEPRSRALKAMRRRLRIEGTASFPARRPVRSIDNIAHN
jgi:hypothetical protein